jgi:hypothetical protein
VLRELAHPKPRQMNNFTFSTHSFIAVHWCSSAA